MMEKIITVICSVAIVFLLGCLFGSYQRATQHKPKYIMECTNKFKGDYGKINNCLDYYERIN